MPLNRHAPQNLDHHCPRCDNELTIARVMSDGDYALALTCSEPYCGYVLGLSARELQLILALSEFEPEFETEIEPEADTLAESA